MAYIDKVKKGSSEYEIHDTRIPEIDDSAGAPDEFKIPVCNGVDGFYLSDAYAKTNFNPTINMPIEQLTALMTSGAGHFIILDSTKISYAHGFLSELASATVNTVQDETVTSATQTMMIRGHIDDSNVATYWTMGLIPLDIGDIRSFAMLHFQLTVETSNPNASECIVTNMGIAESASAL